MTYLAITTKRRVEDYLFTLWINVGVPFQSQFIFDVKFVTNLKKVFGFMFLPFVKHGIYPPVVF